MTLMATILGPLAVSVDVVTVVFSKTESGSGAVALTLEMKIAPVFGRPTTELTELIIAVANLTSLNAISFTILVPSNPVISAFTKIEPALKLTPTP